MDFVDLDKVLDQFEEEEKAAEEILPGQETKPSGYAEFLASHQDRPWETLSFAPSVSNMGKPLSAHSQTVSYDDPYDAYSRTTVADSHNGLKPLNFCPKNVYTDSSYEQKMASQDHALTLEQEMVQAKLKEQTIESYLPQVPVSNGMEPVTVVNGSLDVSKGEDQERRGLIASQPASIQTDMLSPASEQELLSYPLPKSNILVEGHGLEDTEPKLPMEYDSETNTHIEHDTKMKLPDGYEAEQNINSELSTEVSLRETCDFEEHEKPGLGDSSSNEHTTAYEVEGPHEVNVYAGSNSINTTQQHFESELSSGLEQSQGGELTQTDVSNFIGGTTVSNYLRDSREVLDYDTASINQKEMSSAVDENTVTTANKLSIREQLPVSLAQQEDVSLGTGKMVTDTVVGFATDDSEMNSDEVDAYLQDLECSVPGDNCSGVEPAEPAAALPQLAAASLDGQQAQVVMEAGESPAVSMGDRDSTSASNGVKVSDSAIGTASEATTMNGEFPDSQDNSLNSVISDNVATQPVESGVMVVDPSSDITDPVSSSNSTSQTANRQPDVVADIGCKPSGFVADGQAVNGIEAGEQKQAVLDSSVRANKQDCIASDEVNDDRQAGSASLIDGNTNEQRDNASIRIPATSLNTKIVPEVTSLEFPVSGNENELSSVVKGKLEIEGLLDEIVAARLAHKAAQSRTAEPALGMQDAPVPAEQTVVRESVAGDNSRTQGWGPEGSMVCSQVREPSSSSPAESSSPSPTLGIGARPKDPSQMKKNRPNSLLGLSKISIGSPFSPPQQSVGPVVEVMLPAAQQQQAVEERRRPVLPHHTEPGEADGEPRTHSQSMEVRHLGAPPPKVSAPASDGAAVPPADGAQMGMESTVEMSGSEEDMETPVMRRADMQGDRMLEDGVEASNGTRPQSWSPSTLSSPPAQKTKRPTSLNLPVRQDRMGSLSPDGDNIRSRKAGIMQEAGLVSETGSSEEESMAVGSTDTFGCDNASSAEQERQEGAAAAAEIPPEAPPPSILHLNLGKIAPTWVPDADATTCMECAARFTFTKRRHHCRACGKIFCSTCCGQKSRLTYLENKEGRVCVSCYQVLSSAECVRPAGVSCRSPNPNNPIEYCSTVPPTQQANARAPLPTVMVPTGVLKRHGSSRKSEPKQVMFSDGIRPGGDLTELDGSDQTRIPPRRTGRVQKKVEKQQGDHSSAKTRRLRGSDGTRNPCLIPDEGLPPVVVHTDDKGDVSLSENPDTASLMAQIRNEEASPVTFAINLNLFVQVKIINLDCCVNRVVWCFTTHGMVTVGQEELMVVLETLPDEDTIPRDIFCHFSTVYEEAGKGNTVSNMGHSIFNQPFLGSSSHGGLLYVRSTFQCCNKLLLPQSPYLFAILLQKWETPWAKVFPIRLMLRLGAEHRYYPCPLVSIRNRKPVFYEIGHTIMNLLADFRNFQYMLQQIRGVSIHMEDKKTFINFPRNRYEEVMKVVSSSNEHVMALGASFSLEADSHLVCIQNEDGNYQTQAINIQNKPRQVTGASFVVFNGALKSSSGLRAKSSIVEDGLMVQIMPEMMAALKQSMKDMVDFSIPCGSVTVPQPEEVVTVRWVDDDKRVNVGVKSPVDGMSMEGVESVHVHNATDYVGERFAIRWTEVFFLQTESGSSRWEPVDLSRVAETLATAVCIALTPHLQKLREAGLTKIGLRVTLQPDSVGYEVGSKGERLPDFYMNDLDNALIPVIHGAISHSQDGPIVLELVLYIIH